ncbi:tyrosine-type recombinase/integrase [Nonomuraea bangladeshensis]|uniref:tyrosine-type recombinase/integrase n=1 Tax=Nonomuraea bangladeshensis TaxID=404385 RepID=UPI003C2C8955
MLVNEHATPPGKRLETTGRTRDSSSPLAVAGLSSPSNFRRSFANACAKAGVRKVHVHATRKTCASLLVALDVHPRVAMQILRHSQIAVTMNVYSEVSSQRHVRLSRSLAPICIHDHVVAPNQAPRHQPRIV